ncbi:MAG: hypothetical protein KC635_02625, partial [Myxococcales bacterium]|nr:hypothetical protein [Myxococcales bacterium]
KIVRPTPPKYKDKIGATVLFGARCLDGKSDGDITWKASGGQLLSAGGGSARVKFPDKGKFTITASADTETCKGSDSIVVTIEPCVDVGTVRVCGDTIHDDGGGKYTVGPQATLGIVAPEEGTDAADTTIANAGQFLKCSKSLVADTAANKVTGDCRLSLDIAIPAIGKTWKDRGYYDGPFTLAGDGKFAFSFAEYVGNSQGQLFDIILFPIAMASGGTAELRPDGVAIGFPAVQFMKPKTTEVAENLAFSTKDCGAAEATAASGDKIKVPECDLQEGVLIKEERASNITFSVDRLLLSPVSSDIDVTFKYDKEVELGGGSFNKIEATYKGVTDQIAGTVGFSIGPKLKRIGFELSGEWAEGKMTKASLKASFAKRFGDLPVALPGIPIWPASAGPLYLTAITLSVTNPCYITGGCPQTYPTMTVSSDVAVGPAVVVGGEEVSAITGSLTGTWQTYPTKIELSGTAQLLGKVTGAIRAVDTGEIAGYESVLVSGLGTLKGAIGLDFNNDRDAKVYLNGSLTFNNPLSVKDPLAVAEVSTSITRSGDNFVGRASVGGKLYIPKFKIWKLGPFGGQQYAGANLFIVSQSLPAKPHDPVMEVSGDVMTYTPGFGATSCSARLSVEYGVFVFCTNATVGGVPVASLDGVYGNYNASTPALAPSIGLAAGDTQRLQFDGTAPEVEVIEPIEGLWLQIEHDGGVTYDLELPGGAVVHHDADVDPANLPPAAWIELEGDDTHPAQNAWVVPVAEPGAYRLVNIEPPQAAIRMIARSAPEPASFAFDEPLVADDGAVDVVWTAAHPRAAVSVVLSREDVARPGELIEVATVDDALTTTSATWSLDGVPPGDYRVVASVRAGDDAPTTVRSTSVIHVAGAAGSTDVPALVRVAPGAPPRVSWLPVPGASGYRVHWEPAFTVPDFFARVAAGGVASGLPDGVRLALCAGGDASPIGEGHTWVDLAGVVDGCVVTVTVSADFEDRASASAAPVRFGDGLADPTRVRPPKTARAGEALSAVLTTGADAARLMALSLSSGVSLAGGTLAWTPTLGGDSAVIGIIETR